MREEGKKEKEKGGKEENVQRPYVFLSEAYNISFIGEIVALNIWKYIFARGSRLHHVRETQPNQQAN